ncbi:MAG: hypothetical protein IJ129_06035 [Ruminococcus sp.]|nr:hypothetical protein [Ruminococcus sp.]
MAILKKADIDQQLDQTALWEGLERLIPEDDPLKGQVHEQVIMQQQLLEKLGNSDTVDTESAEISGFLDSGSKLLSQVKQKYEGTENTCFLKAHTAALQTLGDTLSKGICLKDQPGGGMLEGLGAITSAVKSQTDADTPEKLESFAKEAGLCTGLLEVTAQLETGAKWQQECAKPQPDISKLEELQNRFFKLMQRLMEEQPEEEKKKKKRIMRGKSLLVVAMRAELDAQEQMENDLLAAEVLGISPAEDVGETPDDPEVEMTMDPQVAVQLKKDMDSLVKGCRNNTISDTERVDLLFKIRNTAKEHPDDPTATKMLGIVNRHLAKPENLKVMQSQEQEAAEREWDALEKGPCTQWAKDFAMAHYKEYQAAAPQRMSMNPQQQQAEFKVQRAKLEIAVSTIIAEKMTRSMLLNTVNEMTPEQMAENGIDPINHVTNAAAELRERPDFKAMMEQVKKPEDVGIFWRKAIQNDGSAVIMDFAKHTKAMINEDTQAAMTAHKESAAKQLHRGG